MAEDYTAVHQSRQERNKIPNPPRIEMAKHDCNSKMVQEERVAPYLGKGLTRDANCVHL